MIKEMRTKRAREERAKPITQPALKATLKPSAKEVLGGFLRNGENKMILLSLVSGSVV